MEYGGGDNYVCSKCTLSPSLWPRLPLLCILNIRQLEFHRITILTRVVVFVFLKRYLFCCLWWVGLSFSLLHPLLQCSEQRFQTNTVRWQMGIFVRKQLFNIHRPFRMLSPRYIHEFRHQQPVKLAQLDNNRRLTTTIPVATHALTKQNVLQAHPTRAARLLALQQKHHAHR